MKIVINRDELIQPLLKIGGVVEKRQTLPILANLLIKVRPEEMSITATDLEVEMQTVLPSKNDEEYEFTLPARKVTDICKALPEGSEISLAIEGERALLRSGRSRFTLSTLPARDYPSIDPTVPSQQFMVPEKTLKRLIEKTHFAMAMQDVRYYLNGLLLEVRKGTIRTVATDGHRLALTESVGEMEEGVDIQVIMPRKTVMELNRLLEKSDEPVRVSLSPNHIRFELKDTVFTSKLIDGRFPDYERVIPTSQEKFVVIDKELLRQALSRASILSNEKYRGIRFTLSEGMLELVAHNPEQEEAEEVLEVDYQGDDQVIGFNVGYLIDVLSVIDQEQVRLELHNANSSALIKGVEAEDCRYVVMPMRL